MFNHFAVTIIERMVGRKMPVVLSELSGTTERTWRNRLKQGWIPTDAERAHLHAQSTAAFAARMCRDGGWPIDEAHAILAGRPSMRTGLFLPTADLIYNTSPYQGAYCLEANTLAEQFDRDCAALSEAVHADDAGAVRQVLIAMLDWLQSFCPDGTDVADAVILRSGLDAAASVPLLLKAAKPVGEALILHVLSCWDLEFCAGYFEGRMAAHPLFQLVMPRFAPDIDIDPGTGRFSRNGRQPRMRVLEPATSRLIDFVAVLAAARHAGRWPDQVPPLKALVKWSNEREERLVSWRDETTRLTSAQFDQLWEAAIPADSVGMQPAVPSPMLACTLLWRPLLVRADGRITHIIDCAANYRTWWERNRDRLVAKGLQFGDQEWPACWTSQRPGWTTPAEVWAAQSSGRASRPRDCQ